MSEKYLSKPEYEESIAATRDQRMRWWREARFGMFIHYGLYAVEGQHEWAMAVQNMDVHEYEKLADRFQPKPEAAREWAELAKQAGMKYMVLTTRHHDGFSLWDSKANPYNSVRYGPKRDIVGEFVDACRACDLRIGFYSSLMDWHHPDGWRCAFDPAAHRRFLDYIHAINHELLSRYGKIDVLWYDVPRPMATWEGWESLTRNQDMRALQPDILINNRSLLDEDFGTPEEHIAPMQRDWEACMTFNALSWGYIDSAQALPYSYNEQQIIRMLNTVTANGGNLLLNIGPQPDGSVPPEAVAPLTKVGAWLQNNGQAVYGRKKVLRLMPHRLCGTSTDDRKVYLWNWIWPVKGELILGGFKTPLKAVRYLHNGDPIPFDQLGHQIRLRDLPAVSPDPHAGIVVLELEFEQTPEFAGCSYYPQLSGGKDCSDGCRVGQPERAPRAHND